MSAAPNQEIGVSSPGRKIGKQRRRTLGPEAGPPAGESGGFLQQLALAETGGTQPGPFGIAVAILLALVTYPIVRLFRRRGRKT